MLCVIGSVIAIIFGVTELVTERTQAAEATRIPWALERLLSTLKDAETGQRGYLLVGDETYLAPFRAAHARLPEDFAAVDAAVGGSPDAVALRSLIDAKMAELDQTVSLRQAGNPSAALALVQTNRGKLLMDRIRDCIDHLASDAGAAAQASKRHALMGLFVLCGGVTGIVVIAVGNFMALRRVRVALAESEKRVALAAKMQALSHLAGGIAHDFNNILHTVRWASEMMSARGRDDTGEVRRQLAILDAAAERGETIVGRLLSFARSTTPQAAPFAVGALLEGLAGTLAPFLGRSITLRIAAPDNLPMALAGRVELETVLVNLAKNACDAMPAGGTLTISADMRTVAGPKPGARHGPRRACVCISVIDDGEGMTEDVLKRVTEPFFTTKPPGKGTGLGLTMARAFAENAGGQLAIDSKPGRGTTIMLFLPRAEPAQEAAAGCVASKPVSGAARAVAMSAAD